MAHDATDQPSGARPSFPDPYGVETSEGTGRRALLGSAMAAGALAVVGAAAPAAAAAAPARHRDTRFAVVPLGIQGGPPPAPDRSGISTALVVNGRTYLVDCGRASLTQFVRAGLDVASLKTLFLSHLHADHCMDLGSYAVSAAQFPTQYTYKEPIDLYGPGSAGTPSIDLGTGPQWANPGEPTPGTAELLRLVNQAFSGSANFFIAEDFIGDPAEMIRAHEVQVPQTAGASWSNPHPDTAPFPVMEDENVRVTATLVPHGAVFPALAYRFDTEHGSIVFSGDTAISSNLLRLAEGADLLVHEAVELDASASRMGWNEVTMKHMREVHTDVAEIGRIAKEANVRAVALTHLVPDAFTHQEWKQALRRSTRDAGFTGGTHICQELQDVPLSRILR